MKYFLLLIFTIVFQSGSYALDSLRTEQIEGKTYIIHQVDPKETLFSLSRRYKIPVDEIEKNNPILASGLKIGDILRIPLVIKNTSNNNNSHIVIAGETLYSISRKYNVSVEDLRQINSIHGNEVIIGQELIIPVLKNNPPPGYSPALPDTAEYHYHVVRQGETLFALSQQYKQNINDLIKWNRLQDNNISIGDSLVIGYTDIQVPSITPDENTQEDKEPVELLQTSQNSEPDNNTESVTASNATQSSSFDDVVVTREMVTNASNYEEVVETGLAELIQDSGDTRKYLALHRTAKTGTIIRVKNEMNGQEVFVRVLGKLPDIGVNEKVLLKISQSAYEKLGAIDKKFRVRISYFPD